MSRRTILEAKAMLFRSQFRDSNHPDRGQALLNLNTVERELRELAAEPVVERHVTKSPTPRSSSNDLITGLIIGSLFL